MKDKKTCEKVTNLDELLSLQKDTLTPAEVAPFLGCTPYSINKQAHDDPKKLGFAVSITGTRVKIPKESFVYFMRYGYASPFEKARRD